MTFSLILCSSAAQGDECCRFAHRHIAGSSYFEEPFKDVRIFTVAAYVHVYGFYTRISVDVLSLQRAAGSRSGSPSSRYLYSTYTNASTPSTPGGKPGDGASLTLGRPRRPSATGLTSATPPPPSSRGSARSNTASREGSPNRGGKSMLMKPR